MWHVEVKESIDLVILIKASSLVLRKQITIPARSGLYILVRISFRPGTHLQQLNMYAFRLHISPIHVFPRFRNRVGRITYAAILLTQDMFVRYKRLFTMTAIRRARRVYKQMKNDCQRGERCALTKICTEPKLSTYDAGVK